MIGKYYEEKTGTYIETAKGIITYGKNGTHIIPARP
ncbi:polymorphic toxin type 50 domain-containing protein [Clostridium butyricum]